MGWQVGIWVVVAVGVFWTVGAYNRLVSLRNALVRSFDPVDLQFTMRHALLDRQIDEIGAVLSNAAERLETLRAACAQSEMARAHAKAHPGAPGAITSLRLADDILTEARARLPVQAIGGAGMAALNAELGAADTALAFARRQFNEAVLAYNHAIRQVPTRLIAAIFGFAPAGTL